MVTVLNVKVGLYHAGLNMKVRKDNHHKFVNDELQVCQDSYIYIRPKKISLFPITRPSPEKPSEPKLFIAFSDQNVLFLSGFRPSL